MMGVNLQLNSPLDMADCVSHARDFHFWVYDQGKTTQVEADSTLPCQQFIIGPNSPVNNIYQLFSSTDINMSVPIGSFDTTGTTLILFGVGNFYVYAHNEFGYVYSDPPANDTLQYKQFQVCYALSEYCFNGQDDDFDGQEDCEDVSECDCSQGSPAFPNQQFKWNPPYQNQAEVHYDYFYDQIRGMGLSVSPSMLGSLPRLALGDGLATLNRIPIQWGGSAAVPTSVSSPLAPASYRERADWLFHFLARYGSGSPIGLSDLKIHPDETPEINRGVISYIESWNEPDRFWNGPAAQFSPEEYAAMASCDYDGHGGTVNINDSGVSHCYGLGVAQFGTSFVMGAPYELDWGWAEAMNNWFVANRPDGAFIFDVLNFHHYSATNINDGEWLCPEQDALRPQLENFVLRRDTTPWAQGRELWLSEFGYSTGGSPGPTFPLVPGADDNLLQAQWIARSFLEIAAAGFDRAYVHDLSDHADFGNPGAWDTQTGLVTADGTPKLSWYFVYSLKNILGKRNYAGEIVKDSCGVADFMDSCGTVTCPRIYKFAKGACDTIYAIWSPSAKGCAFQHELELPCGAKDATAIKLVEGSTYGLEMPLNVVNSKVVIDVSETPIFVTLRPAVVPTCPAVSEEVVPATV